MTLTKSEITQAVHDALVARLSPACEANGLSLKAMPDDTTAGVIRTALLIVFVPGFSDNSSTTSKSAVIEKQVSVLTVPAYILVLAASQVGPRSATWAAGIAIEAIDGAKIDSPKMGLFANSLEFTSFSGGLWQYRIPVDCVVRISSGNLSAKHDIERQRYTAEW